MAETVEVPGLSVPVHRALTEPILLGGAPRAIAIVNGTLAGAVGLGLRLCSQQKRKDQAAASDPAT